MDGVADIAGQVSVSRLAGTAATPLRIAHLTVPGPIGGLETVVSLLSQAQRRAGHDVRVYAVMEQDVPTPFLMQLRDAGVRCEVVVIRGRRYVHEHRALRECLRSFHPDVVHTHGYRSDIIGYTAARALGVPIVSTSHGFTGGDLKNRFNEAVQRWILRRCNAVVAVSRPMHALLLNDGVSSSRLALIPNAVQVVDPLSRRDARAQLGLPELGFILGWVGRLSPEKGVHLFLDALAVCTEVAWTAAILGDGPETASAVAAVEASGLTDRVRFLGPVPGAGRLLRAFDVLLLTSKTEGTPMVVLEAQSIGVPVIATAVGGVPDLLSNGRGTLVRAGDAAALAAAIRGQVASSLGHSATDSVSFIARVESDEMPDSWSSSYIALYRAITRHN